jgi:hypothetical protein
LIVQNSYLYIRIGLWLRHLRNTVAGTKAGDLLKRLETLKQILVESNLEVSLASMQGDHYTEMLEQVKALAADTPISAQLVTSVVKQVGVVEDVVFAESVTKQIYVVPQRRFNSKYLLSSPGSLLKIGAYDKLEEVAKSDFSSSCRCISFGEGTAAAFHILRATESTLKKYYCHHRKQKRLDKPMWGNMLVQLKAKTKNKPPAHLLATLDLIRENYRNPTQHPQATYEIDAAQDLFGVCLDVIGKMTDEL